MTLEDIAFDFARALPSPEIRFRLKRLGFDAQAGDVAVPMLPGEDPQKAASRAVDAGRVLLVTPDVHRAGGWWMQWAIPDTGPTDRPQEERMSELSDQPETGDHDFDDEQPGVDLGQPEPLDDDNPDGDFINRENVDPSEGLES